jgi:hypothetical protein
LKLHLRKLLQRDTGDSPVTEVDESGHSVDEISEEYRSLIIDQLVRGGVSPACVDIEVKQGGKARDGRFIFIGMLRLARWERKSAVRLLVGLPILESRLRRIVRGSWLHDLSYFGGVWLHASGQLQDSHAMEDLRLLLLEVERREAREERQGANSDASIWSLPTDLGGLQE